LCCCHDLTRQFLRDSLGRGGSVAGGTPAGATGAGPAQFRSARFRPAQFRPEHHPHAKEPDVDPIVITVNGMTCGHCVSAVQKEIGALPGVTAVDVELDTGTVRVTADPPPGAAALHDAVDAAGYEMAG
jgi:copper ion binding protein